MKLSSLLLVLGCLSVSAQAIAAQGLLRVSSDGHRLEFDNKRVVLVGDSVTQGWMELGEHFDQAAYVEALATRGINVLHLWSYIAVVDQAADERIGYHAPVLWPWIRRGNAFDLNALDNRYFARLRALVQHANARGIVVIITVHDGWPKRRFSGHPFNIKNGGPLIDRSEYVALATYNTEMPKKFDSSWDRRQKHQYFLERFCDRLIEATGDQPNVMYEIFNEGEWYDQTQLRDFQVHFLRFFKRRTAQPLLINDDHVGGPSFQQDGYTDVISLHHTLNIRGTRSRRNVLQSVLRYLRSDKPLVRALFEQYAPHFDRLPPKPFVFTEIMPEYRGELTQMLPELRDRSSIQDAYMRLIWGTLLAGAAGMVVQNDTSFSFDPRTAITSQISNRDRILDLQGHAARFFNRSGVKLHGLRPTGRLSSTGVALASPDEYVVYSSGGESVEIDFSNSTGDFQARFFNPRSGEFQTLAPVSAQAKPQSIPKPDAGDWVLHLLRRSSVN